MDIPEPDDDLEGVPEDPEEQDQAQPANQPRQQPKKPKTSKAQGAAKKGAEQAGKKVEQQVAKKGILAALKYAAGAVGSWLAGLVGWPVLVGCLAIFLIIIIIFGALACSASKGYFGKSIPVAAGKDDANVKKIIALSETPAAQGHFKITFANARDLEYVKSGKIDRRLAAALAYLGEKHDFIQVSHIVSGYEDLSTNPESGSFHDVQIAKNISAHKNGLAADIDEIDMIKEKCNCGKSIPVKVAWQAMGEDPYGTPPDVLNNIGKASDLANEKVKEALKQAGVQGLDQDNILEQLQTISGINSVYDLTKPEVISALASIGVTGIDNPDLQNGIKRLQAIQQIYDLNPQDLSALTSGASAELLNQIGININPETQAAIAKYQQAQVIQSITSVDDLGREEVREALNSFGINPDDSQFQSYLTTMTNASTVMNWEGNLNDPEFQRAITALGDTVSPDLAEAARTYQGMYTALTTPPGAIMTDVIGLEVLENAGIIPDNPESQDVFSRFRAYSTIDGKIQYDTTNVGRDMALDYLGIDLTDQTSQDIATLMGISGSADFSDPDVTTALSNLGFSSQYYDDLLSYVNLYDVVSGVSVGDLSQAAYEVALENLDIPSSISDQFNTISDWQTVAGIRNVGDLTNPKVVGALDNVGIKIDSPTSAAILGQAADINALLNIKSPADLLQPGTLSALNDLDIINIEMTPELLGQLGAVQTLFRVDSIGDLMNPSSLMALNTLNIISLSNPVLATLNAINMISAIFGVNLLSGLPGQCKETIDCYKPSAQANVHTVISQMLQFPYDMGNPEYYRPIQLITFSNERDVAPFSNELDALYGTNRRNNIGLFSMPEAYTQVHISY